MASGSSGRVGSSGSKGFDFGSDDILCSYEDYGNQDGNNGTHSDSSIGANSSKDIQKSRMERSSVFPATTYSPPGESSFNQDVILTVEKTMKKCTDDLMRFLEGISSRLSQLELYCYNLDKSIGEMCSDLVRNHDESETKLKSLEKHIQEVHRSVQILKDKQELADTQKELAKLQLAQNESSSAINTRENEGRASPPSFEAKKSENSCDVDGRQQLALVPHQVVPQPAQAVEHQQPNVAAPSLISPQAISQAPAFYLPSQLTIQPVLSQSPQNEYLVTQSQLQEFSRMALQSTQSQLQPYVAPQQVQSQLNQSSQVQSLPPSQQSWPQQQQQPVQPSVQPVMQTHIRSPSPPIYSSYLPDQSNQSLAEMITSSIPMQVSFAVASQPGSVGPEAIPYGYGAAGRPIQPHPSIQNLKAGFISQSGDGYVCNGPALTTLPPGTSYMMFDGEVGRMHHPPPQPHFHQGAYPPTSTFLNLQRVPSANMVVPQSSRTHPYSELIEKMVSMGCRGDHVVGVIQRMEENGQPIDFNSVLDRLNGHSSGFSQRARSG